MQTITFHVFLDSLAVILYSTHTIYNILHHHSSIELYNVKINCHSIVSPSCQELINEYTQRPVICPKIMSSIHDNLWSHILWGAAKCPCLFPCPNFFCKPKVYLEDKQKQMITVGKRKNLHLKNLFVCWGREGGITAL